MQFYAEKITEVLLFWTNLEIALFALTTTAVNVNSVSVKWLSHGIFMFPNVSYSSYLDLY